jgi:dTDP-4-amino-4,6-dideoxygalactose transaminase
LQKAYLDPRYKEGDFPVTESLCANVLSLPIHTEMKEDVQKYICAEVIRGLEN